MGATSCVHVGDLGGIWYIHKLIIASSTTTLQISPTLHKLLPVHPTGLMLRVHIFDVGQTNASIRVTCKHYLIHVMYMHKVYHVRNCIIILHILASSAMYIILSL